MRLSHDPGKTHASFDDLNLASRAGLVPVMALAERRVQAADHQALALDLRVPESRAPLGVPVDPFLHRVHVDERQHAGAGQHLAAPELLDLEVTSVLQRQMRAGLIDARRASLALADLGAIPLQRAPHRPLLARCWKLRDNLTSYDAA